MVRQLTTFATEVTRVALEVGTQGILGGQAVVEGVEGVWDDLTTNVNVSQLLGLVTKLADSIENGWQLDRSSARDCRSRESSSYPALRDRLLTHCVDQIGRSR